MHQIAVDSNFEGIMLRNLKGGYKINGRSFDLQKYKAFMDAEFKIIGAEEGSGKNEGMCSFICTTDSGGKFNVMCKGNECVRRKYWEDWQAGTINIGDLLTVEFFEWTTSEIPVPRFPVGKALRNN